MYKGNNAQTESVFNTALAYLESQISDILKLCQQAAMQENPNNWLIGLYALDRSLSVKTSDAEDEELSNSLDQIGKLLMTKDPHNKSKALMLCHNLDKRMRRIAQKKGMLLPSRDDPRFAVLKR